MNEIKLIGCDFGTDDQGVTIKWVRYDDAQAELDRLRAECEGLRAVAEATSKYVGYLGDPNIGWLGGTPSSREYYQCESCKEESIDPNEIPHTETCRVKSLLDVLRAQAAIAKARGRDEPG